MVNMKLLPSMVILGTLVVLLYVFNTMSFPLIDPVIGSNFQAVFPGLLVILFSMIVTAEARNSPGIIGCFTVLGVGVAILLQEMYDAGIIVDAMMGGATIAQYETITIILGLIMGAVAYMNQRR